MKKTYIIPAMLAVQLASRDTMMTVSAVSTLGVSSGGNTSTNKIQEADVKEVNDVNVWDKEW